MERGGIYQIINKADKKIYVGSAKAFSKRWRDHKKLLRKNKHYNRYLQNAWNKYGEDSFEFQILEITTEQLLLEKEQYYLDKFAAHVSRGGYNMCEFAGRPLGRLITSETRKKISESLRGRYGGEKNPFYGKKHSAETLQKIKENSADMSGEKNPFYGKKHSEKTKKLLGQKSKGRNCGEKSCRAKLTWEKVREIRKIYAVGNISHASLGKEFDVAESTIQKIINNDRWVDQ
jgi:group I intron endonuclease